MDYIDYMQLSGWEKFAYRLKHGFLGIPKAISRFFVGIGKGIASFFGQIWSILRETGRAFRYGDWKTRLSFIFMGAGCLFRGQIVKGLAYLLAEVFFILYFVLFGWHYLRDFATLGRVETGEVWNEELQIYEYSHGDNSMLILLFSVLTMVLALAFIILYFAGIKASYRAQRLQEKGKRLPKFREDVKALLNEKFHITLLAVPVVMVLVFTILPLIFMILIAFTNFDKNHQPPGNLFTWVGFQNFQDIFWQDPLKSFTFGNLLVWTLVWAVFATFTNYILGMILALMINKKGIKFKKFWRTIFIITIAVPQFVSLLIMSQILKDQGAVNVLLQQLGLIQEPIPFLSDGTLAKITVVIVNMWVGIPYTMLITSGILMNIPEDLYESARIDGAGPVKTFFKITLPYMLFVTTPYLITQFVGNINNFNVIFLLSGGGPLTLEYYQAGKTDLLVTWLYKQTVNDQNYSLAATIGIMVFIICAVMALIVYNSSASAKKEEEFQ